MILVDTSVWADHFRRADPCLSRLIEGDEVMLHRLVIEELAMGHLPRRAKTLAMLKRLPATLIADADLFTSFIEREELVGSGIGAIDAHLLVSAVATGARLWTRDKRLALHAQRLGCDWPASSPT